MSTKRWYRRDEYVVDQYNRMIAAVTSQATYEETVANANLLAAAPLLLAELIKVRDGTYCQATSADLNGDVCGVTFTCGGCRRRAELTKLIDNAMKGA